MKSNRACDEIDRMIEEKLCAFPAPPGPPPYFSRRIMVSLEESASRSPRGDLLRVGVSFVSAGLVLLMLFFTVFSTGASLSMRRGGFSLRRQVNEAFYAAADFISRPIARVIYLDSGGASN